LPPLGGKSVLRRRCRSLLGVFDLFLFPLPSKQFFLSSSHFFSFLDRPSLFPSENYDTFFFFRGRFSSPCSLHFFPSFFWTNETDVFLFFFFLEGGDYPLPFFLAQTDLPPLPEGDLFLFFYCLIPPVSFLGRFRAPCPCFPTWLLRCFFLVSFFRFWAIMFFFL